MEHVNVSNQNKEHKEDRLSQLPDEILLSVLENVSIRDVARTRTLSKRWTLLPSPSKLILDVGSFLPGDDVSELTSDNVARANKALVRAAKSFLANRSQDSIRHLYLRFYLINDDPVTIGHLVGNAMQCRSITRVDFTILTEKSNVDSTDDEFIDYGRRFKLFIDTCPHAFAGLTYLKLTNTRLTEPDVPNILDTCKNLRCLWLCQCASGYPSLIQIEHPELTEIIFESCGFQRVHLHWFPKLGGVTFRSWFSLDDPLSFGYVPSLKRLNLTNVGADWQKPLRLSELLVNNSTITKLYLNFRSGKIWIQPEERKSLAFLDKLELLNIDDIPEKYDFTWLVFLIQASPHLKRLIISVRDHRCQTKNDAVDINATHAEWEAPDFKHQNLSALTINGFQADENFMKFIKRVMQAAVNLRKISLHDTKACEWCDEMDTKTATSSLMESKYPRSPEAKCLVRQQIRGESLNTKIYFS